MKKLRKAFTITELVIVIAVIAILAAVLIPTFTAVIEKANMSSDQSAVRNMNLALAAAEVDGEVESRSDALAILEDAGMDAQNYRALAKDYAFVWVKSINRVLYVKTDDYSVAYPEEYKDMKYDGTEAWGTLEGAIRGDDAWMDQEIGSDQLTQAAVTYGVMKEENEVKAIKVDTAARLVSAAEFLDRDENKNKAIDLYLGANIDLEGAEWNSIDNLRGNFNGNDYTISNLQMSDNTAVSEQISGGSGNNYTYFGFVSVFSGTRFENVTIEVDIDKPGIAGGFDQSAPSANEKLYGNHTVAGAIGGIFKLGSQGNASVVVEDVTVTGSVVGHSRAAGVVGFIGGISSHPMTGSVTLRNCVNKATVISENYSKSAYSTAGGIVSIVIQTANSFRLEMDGCKNKGSVTGLLSGGMISYVSTNGSLYLHGCSNTGTITAQCFDGMTKVNLEKTDSDAIPTAAGMIAYLQGNNTFTSTADFGGKTVKGILIEGCSCEATLKTDIPDGYVAVTNEYSRIWFYLSSDEYKGSVNRTEGTFTVTPTA